MLAAVLAAAVLGSGPNPESPDRFVQRVPAPLQADEQEPAALSDVIVDGTLATRVETFVREVGAAPKRRFGARWPDRVCPGVVNLDNIAAQAVNDGIAELAGTLDIGVGRPGCDPNVVVIFTADGRALAAEMVQRDRRLFSHPQLGTFNRGDAALLDFTTSDAPVRWWHLSMPVDVLTGERAVRLSEDLRPVSATGAEGRLSNSVVDVLYKAIIIVDVTRLGDTSFEQVADYIAMVAMAQIDPEAEIDGHHTILNVFRQPDVAPGLTEWDQSYLEALYSSASMRRNPGSRRSDIARLMTRDQRAEASDE
jgi:hypothetical protein